MDDFLIRFQHFSIIVNRDVDVNIQYLCLLAPIIIGFYNYLEFIKKLMQNFDKEIRQMLGCQPDCHCFEELRTPFCPSEDSYDNISFRKFLKRKLIQNKFKRFRQKRK